MVSGTLEHLIAQGMGSWNDLLPGQPIRYKGPGKIRKRNQGGSFDDLANVSFADASFTATPLTLTNGDVIKLQVWAGARVYLSPRAHRKRHRDWYPAGGAVECVGYQREWKRDVDLGQRDGGGIVYRLLVEHFWCDDGERNAVG